jgi:penicillin-binding protein 1A
LFDERRQVVPLSDLPGRLPEAFIAIEDTEFLHHAGITPKGIVRALAINAMRGSRDQGASTITQQLPRNLIPEISREKTIERKIKETLIALRMERLYTKDQILEVYLNQIYLGSGTYGVEAASQLYFGKSARDLSLDQIALLAGLPQLPERNSPLNSPERAEKRRNQVLGRLLDLDWITDEEYGAAVSAPIVVSGRTGKSSNETHYFVDGVRQAISEIDGLDARAMRREGWHVRTTMDKGLQEIGQQVLLAGLEIEEAHWLEERPMRFRTHMADEEAWLRPPKAGQMRMARVSRIFSDSITVELPGGWRADLALPRATQALFQDLKPGDGVDVEIDTVDRGKLLWRGRLLPETRLQGALVCLDRRTGAVRSLIGGRKFAEPENNGFFNRALQARRQAGSTMKPFFFAAALEAGMTPETVLYDGPMEFANGYRPRNFEGRFFGPTSLQVALEHSRNIVTIRMVQEIGLRPALERVRAFNVIGGGDAWALPMEIPVVLGTTEVTPLEMAAAYQAFANLGTIPQPYLVEEVRNPSGQQLYHHAVEQRPVLEPKVASLMTQMLLGVMTHGSGRLTRSLLPEGLRHSVAGKSGTTNENRDAWFVGYTSDHVVAVWVGFDKPLSLGEKRSGGQVAGPIWASFVSRLNVRSAGAVPALELDEPYHWVLMDLMTRLPAHGTEAGARLGWRIVGRPREHAPLAAAVNEGAH